MNVQRVGVVGAGQMGLGIAQVAAQAGIDVKIVDAAPDFAQMGIGKLKKTLDRLVERGKLEAGHATRRWRGCAPSTSTAISPTATSSSRQPPRRRS